MIQRETLYIFETEDEIYDRMMSAFNHAMEGFERNKPNKIEAPMTDFETWWYHEGSQGPTAGNDLEEHCKRMCAIAWGNGAFKERERAALKVEELGMIGYGTLAIAAAIRKGDEHE
jgi:hypothetical protein